MATIAVSVSSLFVALTVCAALGTKIQLNFIADAENDALCADVYIGGVHIVKARTFAVSNGICIKVGSGDPKRLPRKDAPRDRKRKFALRPLLAALSAWELRCDRLSVRLTLPLGDHPETEVKLLAANFAFLTATSLLSPQKCDCAIRVADVRRAKLYGSISLSCASALDCALRCLSAAKKAKGSNRA